MSESDDRFQIPPPPPAEPYATPDPYARDAFAPRDAYGTPTQVPYAAPEPPYVG